MQAWHRYILQIVEFNPPLFAFIRSRYTIDCIKAILTPWTEKLLVLARCHGRVENEKKQKSKKCINVASKTRVRKFCELHKWTHHWVLKMRESLFIIALQIFDIRLMKIKACVRRVITDTWHNRNRNLHTFSEIFVPFFCSLRVLLTVIFLQRITYG